MIPKHRVLRRQAAKSIRQSTLLASALIGLSSFSHAGTAITTVESTLGGGHGVYMDLQSDAVGVTNQGVTGVWSNWVSSWGFGSQGASTGDGSANNGPGDTSDSALTVFGRSADDKSYGGSGGEIQVDYSGLTPNATYFLWAVVMQNTTNARSHDLEWGLTSGALTRVSSPETPAPGSGSPYPDSAYIAGAVAGSQLAGFPLGEVTADGSGLLTIYYDRGNPASNSGSNLDRTQLDGVLFEEIVDPHCLLPWAPNGTVIASDGEPVTIQIPVKNIGASATLTVTGASVTGADGGFFLADGDQFPIDLAPDAEGTIALNFDPGTFSGPLDLGKIEILSNHGGTPNTLVTSPISGEVRNPWISTVDSIAVGPIPSVPGSTSFTVEVTNLGFSETLEITGAFPTGDDETLFTVDTDFNSPMSILPGTSATIALTFDSGGAGVGTYTTNLEIDNSDNTVQVVALTVVVADEAMQLVVNGYDPGTGDLSVTATKIPVGPTFHLEQSTDLQAFGILSPPVDFDSTNEGVPMLIPVDPSTDPALFLQAFDGASAP